MVLGVSTGMWAKSRADKASLRSAEDRARHILSEAETDAAHLRKSAELDAKEEYFKRKSEFEEQLSKREAELEGQLQRRQRLEMKLERKIEQYEHRQLALGERTAEVEKRLAEIDAERQRVVALEGEARHRLEGVAGLTTEEAKRVLMSEVEASARQESAALLRQVEADTRDQASKKSRQILTLAIQKCAAEVVTETTVSVIQLASDDMKGRIIGREGRNIRSLEAVTGVNVIVDDTPEAIVLSCYDPLRREVARLAIERLLGDGRIHPARIEEVVHKVEEEMAEQIKAAGERAFQDLGIADAHPDVVSMLGRLKYRTSYGQNILAHSIEVAHLCGALAAELGADVPAARRAGLLHDIGKAMSSELEGTHALLGAEFCKRLGESPAVVHAIAAHHNEEEPKTVVAVLLQAADAVSASRPGARRESLELYLKRLKDLEAIATGSPGVTRAYALQAGRELRIMVEPTEVDDAGCTQLARDVSKRIAAELQFPGQIKVTVLREVRVVEFAR